MREPNKRKAYSYLRFSRPEQARGASRKRQADAAAAYAAEHELDLDETLRDEGISAFRGRHRDPTSALGAFLAKVGAGQIQPGSVLIVESLDRLSREQVLDALELLLGLVRLGIEVVTLADRRSYSRDSIARDSTALVYSIMIMTRANEESETKSRRVGDAWARKKAAAVASRQAMTARCPGWIRLVGGPKTGHYEPIPEREAIVREIFGGSIAGEGRRTIVKRLNARGEATWGVGKKQGLRWHDSYVAKILRSPASYGCYRVGDEEISGYFPAAISEDDFWCAQGKAASRGSGRGRTSARFNNLLRNVARCASCDANLVYLDKGRRSSGPVLTCGAALAKAGCSRNATFPYKGLELLVTNFYAHLADAATFATDAEAREAESIVLAAEAKTADLKKRRTNLLGAIEGSDDASQIPEIMARVRQLAGAIRAAEGEMAALRRASADKVDLVKDIEERHHLVNEMIASDDPIERYRGRAQLNARLAKFVERATLDGHRISFTFRAGYDGMDRAMRAAYGSDPEESAQI